MKNLKVGDFVLVTHNAEDLFDQDFQGKIVSIDNYIINVRDQDDAVWSCDKDQVFPLDEENTSLLNAFNHKLAEEKLKNSKFLLGNE